MSNGPGTASFTDEFKTEAVALLASSGRRLMQIAGELDIAPSMLRTRRNRTRGGMWGQRRTCRRGRARPRSRPRRQRSAGFRENDQPRRERDILKTYGPPRPQVIAAFRSEQSASTYPACR